MTKAYTTRVGSGPFPTEMPDLEASEVRDRGKEYGAVTGRPRRCGWLDLAVLRYAVMINGITSLVVTKLDVFDTQREIQVCIGYRLQGLAIWAGSLLREMPAAAEDLAQITPEYRTLPGWLAPTEGVRDRETFAQGGGRLSEIHLRRLGVEIGMISTGPERDATIVRPERNSPPGSEGIRNAVLHRRAAESDRGGYRAWAFSGARGHRPCSNATGRDRRPGACGRVLAEPVLADRDYPPFDRSTRDGFAVRAADATHAGARTAMHWRDQSGQRI